MSIVSEILESLWNTSLNYKGMHVNIFGIPKFKNYKKQSVRVAFHRLQKENYISGNLNACSITKKGKYYLKNKSQIFKSFESPFTQEQPRNLICMFDVPENKKAGRDWLRFQLKKFNYIMIQKSVWVGPSPLPKEFLDYIKSIGLKDGIRTFKLAHGFSDK